MSVFRRNRRSLDIWPGFVDALASLLMVFVFILLIFMLAQFFLTDTLAGRNKALEQLRSGIEQLSDTLSLEQGKNRKLETLADRLSGQLDTARARAREAEATAADLERRLAEAERTIETDRETIKLKLKEIASLEDDIAALKEVRTDLENEVTDLASELEGSRESNLALRDRTKKLETRLADERERTTLAQEEIEQRDIRIEALTARLRASRSELTEQEQETADADAEVRRLNTQIQDLRSRISELASALEASEATVQDQKTRIEDLGQRLNVALARKVEELNRYRSEFFGRLREVLGEHPDIRIVGDRFLFQSELFFDSGSAELGEEGKRQLKQLASSLREISARIPEDIDWILRIDGHTDRRPIDTEQFPSNWELSTARALSIVRYLVDQGIPPRHLAAAGFGEYHPLEERHTEEAYSRNRRIEIKLTRP